MSVSFRKSKLTLRIMVSMCLIALIMISIIFIINEVNKDSQLRKMKIGFENSELQQNDWIGITSDKAQIKVGDDLNVKVYYGTTLNYPDDFLSLFQNEESYPSNVITKLCIKYGTCELELLDKGCFTYQEPEYIINSNTTNESVVKVIELFGAEKYPRKGIESEYDTITLSPNYFSEKAGFICFYIREYGVYDGSIDQSNAYGTGASFYYIVNDNIITLYSKYSDFYNALVAYKNV